jgi:hypothetical protein
MSTTNPIEATPQVVYVQDTSPRNGLGLTALITGIVGSVAGLIPLMFWLAGPLGITALLTGIVGVNRVKKGRATNKKTAIFGVIFGVIAFALAIVGIVIIIHGLNQLSDDLNSAS